MVGGGGVLSVASLVAASLGNAGGSVDDDGTAKAGKNPLAGARKRLDRLGSGALNPSATPLPKTIAERVERKAAYEATGVAVGEWQDVVKANREKPTLKFTDQERDKMNRVKSLASMNANFSAGGDGATDFEKLIMAKIKSSGLETGKDVEKAEDLQLNALTAEEANERRSRLAKMRNLLFRHELKHKRVKGKCLYLFPNHHVKSLPDCPYKRLTLFFLKSRRNQIQNVSPAQPENRRGEGTCDCVSQIQTYCLPVQD